jgi:hypothetical protein
MIGYSSDCELLIVWIERRHDSGQYFVCHRELLVAVGMASGRVKCEPMSMMDKMGEFQSRVELFDCACGSCKRFVVSPECQKRTTTKASDSNHQVD